MERRTFVKAAMAALPAFAVLGVPDRDRGRGFPGQGGPGERASGAGQYLLCRGPREIRRRGTAGPADRRSGGPKVLCPARS